MSQEEKLKLYKYAVRRGYNCPSPSNYPKRFDLYIKTHQIYLESKKSPYAKIAVSIIVSFIVCITLMLSI